MYEGLERIVNIPSLVDATFAHKYRLASVDSAAANDRCENAYLARRQDWASFVSYCQVHKNMTVATRTNEIVNDDLSGLLSAMLCLGQVGQMRAFRREFRAVLRERLVIRHGVASAEARGDLDVVLATFSQGNGLKNTWTRRVVGALLNYDVRLPDVVCRLEEGCCESPAGTMEFSRGQVDRR